MADIVKKFSVLVESKVGNSLKDIEKLANSSKKATTNVEALGVSAQAASTAIGVFTGSLAADVVKAFGEAIASVVINIGELGAKTQKTVAAFSAMKNYVGDATEAYRAFNDVGRNTNFDLDAVQQMGAQLLNMGYTARNAADLIQLCADTAAGLNQGQAGAQQLVDTLSRIQATGEMSSRQLISLQMAGMDLDKAFASVGMTAEQAMKAMDNGTLDAQTAIKALTDYMHEFDGSMAESKKNIVDMWGDLAGNINTIMGEVGASIFDAFNQSEIIQKLIDFTQDLVDMVRSDTTGAFTDLKDIASEVLSFIGGLLGVVLDTIKLIIVVLHDAYAAFKSFGSQVLDAVRPAVDIVLELYDAVRSVLSAVGKSFGEYAGRSWRSAYGTDPNDADSYAILQGNRFRSVSKSTSSSGGGGGASAAVTEQQRAVEALIKKYSDVDKALRESVKAQIEVSKVNIKMMSNEQKLIQERIVNIKALDVAHEELMAGYTKELDIAKQISDEATKNNVIEGINKKITAENELYEAKKKLINFEADEAERKYKTEAFNEEMQHISNLYDMYEISAQKRIELENGVLEERKKQLQEMLDDANLYKEDRIAIERQLAEVMTQIHQNAVYDIRTGWQEALRELANQQVNFKDTFTSAFGSIENSLVSLVSGTESAKDKFKRFCEDITKTILQSMAQIIIRGLITNAILSAIGMGTKSIGVGNTSSISSLARSFTGGTFWQSGAGISVSAASGGYITGPGTATSDSIPAMLSNGEYVLNAEAVKRIGVPKLNSINNGGVPSFASGGYVGNNSSNAPSVVVNINNESGVPMDAQQTGGKFDGESYIVSVVMNAVATNKFGMRNMVKGVAAT